MKNLYLIMLCSTINVHAMHKVTTQRTQILKQNETEFRAKCVQYEQIIQSDQLFIEKMHDYYQELLQQLRNVQHALIVTSKKEITLPCKGNQSLKQEEKKLLIECEKFEQIISSDHAIEQMHDYYQELLQQLRNVHHELKHK